MMRSCWKERRGEMGQWATGRMNANENGFTLIEILIALAVFSIGMLAIGGLQVSSISGNARASLVTRAGAFASNEAERLKEAAWSGVTATSITEKDGFQFQTVVTDDTPLQPLALTPGGAAGPYQRSKTVTIIVYGDSDGKQEILRYTFIKVRVI